MTDYKFWKTVSIRVGLLLAIQRLGEKPTRVVDELVTKYVIKRAKEANIDIDDIVSDLGLDEAAK